MPWLTSPQIAQISNTVDFQTTDGQGSLVSRLAGDEFTVILRGSGKSLANSQPLQQLLRGVEKPLSIGRTSRQVSLSIGMAEFPLDGQTVSQLLHAADLKLYDDKNYEKLHEFKYFCHVG